MAVLVEAISVVVRREAIDRSFASGWDGFISLAPNAALCTDHQLARVGFMDPDGAQRFVNDLQSRGLTFLSQTKCADIYPDSSIVRKTACHGAIFGFVMGHDLRRLFVSR